MFTVPEGPPINISIIPADSSSILIHWLPPPLPNGIIKWYDLYINYTNNSDITRVIVNGDSNIYFLDDLHEYQLVGVSISASTEVGEGPASSYKFNRSGKTG